MADQINPGDVVRVSTTPGFHDADGDLADPTVVKLVWLIHDEETTWVFGTDEEIVQDSTGLYHADIPVTAVGTYRFRWEGSGSLVAAEEGSFRSTSRF